MYYFNAQMTIKKTDPCPYWNSNTRMIKFGNAVARLEFLPIASETKQEAQRPSHQTSRKNAFPQSRSQHDPDNDIR